MNIKGFLLASILGISTPAITTIAISNPVMAGTLSFPEGNFSDGTWSVTLGSGDSGYSYHGTNLNNGQSIYLSSVNTSRNNQRELYTWRNGQNRYQVAYRSNDPNFIRVQVFSPSGKVILNRLLTRQ
jgi:hypothetical protein